MPSIHCRARCRQRLSNSRHRLHLVCCALVLTIALGILSGTARAADDRNPLANDPKAAKAGEYEFRINCALCHGLGAHGGGRGPDLTRAQKKHTHSDSEMFQVISNGIPGTAMPSGLFRREADRWVFSGPVPESFRDYHGDHADLLVRYMFQLTPEEQRLLIGRSPAAASGN